MPLAAKVLALLTSLSPADVQALPPFERRRLADLCRYVAQLAERQDPPQPSAGVLALLDRGDRAP
jgi:hypothetical protein